MNRVLRTLLLFPVWLLDHMIHFVKSGAVQILSVKSDAHAPHLVHVWYARTLQGSTYHAVDPSAKQFGHVVLNTNTWKFTAGLQQTGTRLELDSPFAERSMALVGRRLNVAPALGKSAPSMKGCAVRVFDQKPASTAPLPDGPALVLHRWEFDGGAESVSGEVHWLRYLQGGKTRWSLRKQSLWLGKERCYAGPDGTAWMLYEGLDLRMRAWRLADGAILADRYVVGGLL
jgi:hypothetical protein